jgi:hypothetical protein
MAGVKAGRDGGVLVDHLQVEGGPQPHHEEGDGGPAPREDDGPENMPFDMARMGWGGFKPIVEA